MLLLSPIDTILSNARHSILLPFSVAAILASSEPSFAATLRLEQCPYESNCISSNYLEPPNRFISPLSTLRDRDGAFEGAVRDLASRAITIDEVIPRDYFIHLTVPGTFPGSLDDIEIVFGDEGIVNLKCQARVTLPPPPFCIKKNCINGNMDQRMRLESLAQKLRLPFADQEHMAQHAKWTPIFFNSDRVPGFDDI